MSSLIVIYVAALSPLKLCVHIYPKMCIRDRVEVEYTLQYMEVLRRLGKDIPELDKSLCHIIASGMFNGIFEIVVHDMPREQALRDVDQLRDFYTDGWLKLMGD